MLFRLKKNKHETHLDWYFNFKYIQISDNFKMNYKPLQR